MLKDKRIVVTLDAGGTNLVFGAMRGGEFITVSLRVTTHPDDLDRCLADILGGFRTVIGSLPEKPAAVSFAFPGPADYPRGIIGGYLPNFPSFRHGVALGPFLEHALGLPVFINNDGDLFAYGEALCGALPAINARLEAHGSHRRYRNLLGYTFGTGLGVGMVVDGRLNRGDNSCVETFCVPSPTLPGMIAEDSVSIRAVCREYARLSGDTSPLTPKEICEIADGQRPGDAAAARAAFEALGHAAGLVIAVAAQLVDAPVVIGGGLTGARHLFMPALLQAMRSSLGSVAGEPVRRLQQDVYDLDDPEQFALFARGESRKIAVPGTDHTVDYDPAKRIGVAISPLGASRAISAGAYAYALTRLDQT